MIPYRWPVLDDLPRTLEKRLEIMRTMRLLDPLDENEELRRRRAEAAVIRRDLQQIAIDLFELKRACDPRLRSYVIKYNPAQPRVPAGNSDGGEWTSDGGTGVSGLTLDGPPSNGTSRTVQYAALDTGTRTDATEGDPGVEVAAGSDRPAYPIDLLEEESRGGHTIGAHVGVSKGALLSEIRKIQLSAAEEPPELTRGLREGSFTSLEAANKLVNATIAQNQAKVTLVVGGLSPRQQLDAVFAAPTGYEAYAKTGRTEPYIRGTNGVRVIIVPDPSSPKRYRVDTAFPRTFDR